MRVKGKISEWNDDRGFGFISPFEGGERVFCHIKAFADRSTRPTIGKIVTYDVSRDERGRPRATQIRYSGTPASPAKPAAPSRQCSLIAAILGSSTFLIVVTALVASGRATWWVLPWYLGWSVVTFMAYGWDKVSAQGGHWRTQESTLNSLALLGGWPGAWVAQHAWRHKSRKASFLAAFCGAALINVGVFGYLVAFGVDYLGR